MLSAVPTRRELLAWIVALALAATVVVSWNTDRADAGAGPPPPATRTVFIATGENFPDALGAAGVAGAALAPVLLVQQDSIPQATLDELDRLEPRQIVIVGGTAVISAGVEAALNGLGFSPLVTRISGTNRYLTAVELSAANFPTTGLYPRVAFVRSPNISDGAGGTPDDLMLVSIEAPDYGYLVIDGGADFRYDTSSAIVSCWIWVDDNSSYLIGSLRFTDLDTANSEEDCSTQVTAPIEPGVHTVAFRANQDANVTIGEGALNVLWVPFGSFGGTPAP